MSFIDDFVYKVRTGRLFTGFEKSNGGISQQITALESKLEALEKASEGISALETKVGEIEGINRGIKVLETKMEVLEEMDKEIMVLETKVGAIEEMSKEVIPEEPSSKSPEELKEGIKTEESQSKIKENIPDIRQSMKKQIGPDTIIHFVFMEKTYIVENFNLNFRQDMNTLKNRPDSFTYGGTMQISLSGFLDPALDEWLTQTYLTRNGEICFFPNMPKITDSSLLTIFFTDAYCTACTKVIDVETSGVLTTLTICPRNIKIGNEEFENKWKEKESLSFTIKSV